MRPPTHAKAGAGPSFGCGVGDDAEMLIAGIATAPHSERDRLVLEIARTSYPQERVPGAGGDTMLAVAI
jgi:hypothetical protein